MSMEQPDFHDADERAAWELIGRHQAIEPSFGFAERTLRRLHEQPTPARSWLRLPVLRWAAVMCLLIGATVGLWMTQRRERPVATAEPEVVAYAQTQGEDYLEDFDVIASLDQLDAGGSQL